MHEIAWFVTTLLLVLQLDSCLIRNDNMRQLSAHAMASICIQPLFFSEIASLIQKYKNARLGVTKFSLNTRVELFNLLITTKLVLNTEKYLKAKIYSIQRNLKGKQLARTSAAQLQNINTISSKVFIIVIQVLAVHSHWLIFKMLSLFRKLQGSDTSLLGPNLQRLQKWGMWQRQGFFSNFTYYYIFFGCIYIVPSQYIELWVVRKDHDKAILNLSYSLLTFICFIKAATFVIWQRRWTKVINYVLDLEKYQNAVKDEKTANVIEQYTKYSRILTSFYWVFSAVCTFLIIVAPLLGAFVLSGRRQRILNGTDPYPEIMSSWVPFNKSSGWGYCALIILQASVFIWASHTMTAYDSITFIVMNFFAGQLKILKINCENLFEGEVPTEEVMKRLKYCFEHYENLVKHSKIFNSVLSPVLFLYVILCSIVICTSATRLTTEEITPMQQIWQTVYFGANILQLFFYCWHSNEVYYNSLDVDKAVFSSGWWSCDVRMRRNVLLLGGKMSSTIVFTAGPFTTLDLNSFISILKASYSYYTLLK